MYRGLDSISTDLLVEFEGVVVRQVIALSFKPANVLKKIEAYLGQSIFQLRKQHRFEIWFLNERFFPDHFFTASFYPASDKATPCFRARRAPS